MEHLLVFSQVHFFADVGERLEDLELLSPLNEEVVLSLILHDDFLDFFPERLPNKMRLCLEKLHLHISLLLRFFTHLVDLVATLHILAAPLLL